ncbi:unnamed protein product [Acanthoscelides obtectus]|uniref:Ketimine reductase mu-crystallin n=1 Tax=Acanthoscelides obtectus TaxID=200917 RepID=A0A9P0L1K2_ACAOB|nr:unnamed protein product [Acanthoscelides obtectus]CAK1650860.1 Ketimine reductase mu-crystallin [Acanthoscelides obtectus]
MLYINESNVKDILTWEKTFEAVEVAMKRLSSGQTVQMPRTHTIIPGSDNVLLTMPGYLKDEKFGALGCKLVTYFPGNPKRTEALPSINANIMILDEATGIMKAVVAGTEITTQRTSAASAVATKYLYVNQGKACNILAILGTGIQGRIHAEMFRHFFHFQEIRLWNRTKEKAKSLAEELNRKFDTNVFKYYENNESCVRGADVIVTTTASPVHIVHYAWVKPGAHINAVGASRNHFSELDEQLYRNSDLYLDSVETMKPEMAGLDMLTDSLRGEVGAVINKMIPSSPNERPTIFNGGESDDIKYSILDAIKTELMVTLFLFRDKTSPWDGCRRLCSRKGCI